VIISNDAGKESLKKIYSCVMKSSEAASPASQRQEATSQQHLSAESQESVKRQQSAKTRLYHAFMDFEIENEDLVTVDEFLQTAEFVQAKKSFVDYFKTEEGFEVGIQHLHQRFDKSRNSLKGEKSIATPLYVKEKDIKSLPANQEGEGPSISPDIDALRLETNKEAEARISALDDKYSVTKSVDHPAANDPVFEIDRQEDTLKVQEPLGSLSASPVPATTEKIIIPASELETQIPQATKSVSVETVPEIKTEKVLVNQIGEEQVVAPENVEPGQQEDRVRDDLEMDKKMEIKKCVEDTLDSMRRIKNVLSSREDYRLADLFENPDFLSVEANNLEDIVASEEVNIEGVTNSLKRIAESFYFMQPHGANASHDDYDSLAVLTTSINYFEQSIYGLVKSLKSNYQDSRTHEEAIMDLVKYGELAMSYVEEANKKIQKRRYDEEFIQV